MILLRGRDGVVTAQDVGGSDTDEPMVLAVRLRAWLRKHDQVVELYEDIQPCILPEMLRLLIPSRCPWLGRR